MKAILLLLAFPLSIVISAFILLQLWAWFIVPTFGLEPLALGQAAGLSLIIGYLRGNTDNDTASDSTEAVITIYTKLIVYPIAFLGMGWIYTLIFATV